MSFAKLHCENQINPLGLGEPNPRFSWVVSDRHPVQTQHTYQLQVWAEDGSACWDSGPVVSGENLHLPCELELRSQTRYDWRVRIGGEDGELTRWSPEQRFETAFLAQGDWKPRYIGRARAQAEDRRPSYVRKVVEVPSAVKQARVAITALGLYSLEINGEQVGEDWLVPGWTNYHKRNQYVIYDIARYLQPGKNCFAITVADGWYAGHLLFGNDRNIYGATPAVAARFDLWTDGNSVPETIETDSSWKLSTGALQMSDIYDGEIFDARKAKKGWTDGAYVARGWKSAEVVKADPGKLEAKVCPPVRTREVLHPTEYWQQAEDTWTYDFGQNLVGVARIRLPKAPRGHKVSLRFGEMLEEDGSLFDNLRNARCIDDYIYSGEESDEFFYEPQFTYHGFRYVEVINYPGTPPGDILEGKAFYTDLPETGKFRCSNREVNRLVQNILWGQRGNFVEIPTDCPQRDERLGWTGDAQVFLPAACYFMDLYPFFLKWLRDLRDDQVEDGAYPDVAPDVLSVYRRQESFKNNRRSGTAGWGDAGVICPWILYERYGDIRILEENFEANLRWIDYCESTTTGLIRPDTNYGDWLDPLSVRPMDAQTPNQLVGTAYFARSTELTARIAEVLGKGKEAKRLWTLWKKIKKAFAREFVTPNGRLVGDTQTGYTLALGFDLLEERWIAKAVDRLEQLFVKRDYKISTGFLGASLVCDVLSRYGKTGVAYEALMQREYPGWLFTVRNGATTMWECWNSWTPNHGFRDAEMNSFNHYAYGAVGNWMFQNVLGIMPDSDAPAFRHFVLKPEPNALLQWARGSYDSPRGQIEAGWKLVRGGGCDYRFKIPPNTSAELRIPALEAGGKIKVNGKVLPEKPVDGLWIFPVGPGKVTVNVR